MLCASLIFIGLFVCFFGHRFFKTEMFLVGLITGFILTFILISLIADLETPGEYLILKYVQVFIMYILTLMEVVGLILAQTKLRYE